MWENRRGVCRRQGRDPVRMVSRLQTSRGALRFDHHAVCGWEAIYENSLPSEIGDSLQNEVRMPEPAFRFRSESEQPELVERAAKGMVQVRHRG